MTQYHPDHHINPGFETTVEENGSEIGIAAFPTRLRETIGNKSIRSFARNCGFSEGVLRSYLKGDTYPALDRLQALAKTGGVDESWLATGVGTAPCSIRSAAERRADYNARPPLPRAGKYALGRSAGIVLHAADAVIHTIGVQPNWLNEHGLTSQQLYLITASGDSMQPTIRPGSLLLVEQMDTAQFSSDGIYVIHNNGVTLLRRLQQEFDGSVRIISDNPAYREQLVPKSRLDELKISGKVIWIAYEL